MLYNKYNISYLRYLNWHAVGCATLFEGLHYDLRV